MDSLGGSKAKEFPKVTSTAGYVQSGSLFPIVIGTPRWNRWLRRRQSPTGKPVPTHRTGKTTIVTKSQESPGSRCSKPIAPP